LGKSWEHLIKESLRSAKINARRVLSESTKLTSANPTGAVGRSISHIVTGWEDGRKALHKIHGCSVSKIRLNLQEKKNGSASGAVLHFAFRFELFEALRR
jgi:hypothetical protein